MQYIKTRCNNIKQKKRFKDAHAGHLFTEVELREPPLEPPEEERPGLGPRYNLPHRAPGFHSPRRVVKVGELHGNLRGDGPSTRQGNSGQQAARVKRGSGAVLTRQ